MTLDRDALLWINGWPEAWSPFLTFFSNATNYLWVKVLLGVVFVGLLAAGSKTRLAALLSVGAVALANPLTDVLKHFFPTHRPFQPEALGAAVHLRVGYAASMGTASAHAANMTAVATVMFLVLGPWGWPWAVIALLTAVSRVYTGAHFPSQVLLGVLCGFTMGWLVVWVYRLSAERWGKKVEPEGA